jgi:hypothetical protein
VFRRRTLDFKSPLNSSKRMRERRVSRLFS